MSTTPLARLDRRGQPSLALPLAITSVVVIALIAFTLVVAGAEPADGATVEAAAAAQM
jgi:uncharacterized protein (UPF0333 family)